MVSMHETLWRRKDLTIFRHSITVSSLETSLISFSHLFYTFTLIIFIFTYLKEKRSVAQHFNNFLLKMFRKKNCLKNLKTLQYKTARVTILLEYLAKILEQSLF